MPIEGLFPEDNVPSNITSSVPPTMSLLPKVSSSQIWIWNLADDAAPFGSSKAERSSKRESYTNPGPIPWFDTNPRTPNLGHFGHLPLSRRPRRRLSIVRWWLD